MASSRLEQGALVGLALRGVYPDEAYVLGFSRFKLHNERIAVYHSSDYAALMWRRCATGRCGCSSEDS